MKEWPLWWAVGKRSRRVILPAVRLPVSVAHAVEGESAVLQQNRFATVFRTDRPRSAIAAALSGAWPADRIQGPVAGLDEDSKAQLFEIPPIGRQTDLRAAAEIGGAFAQRGPGFSRFALSGHAPPHFELERMVDGGLGGQHAASLVVHFVLLQEMLHAHPLVTFLPAGLALPAHHPRGREAYLGLARKRGGRTHFPQFTL
jgi:hypothetical protein